MYYKLQCGKAWFIVMEMESGKRAVTRRSIMHAARKLYEEQGIENTPFGEIAKAAGVSRSTVFNYFANTGELLTALCGQEVEDLESTYERSGCRGRDGIMCIFDTFIEDTACYPQLVTKLVNTAVINGGEGNPLKMIENLIRKNLGEVDEPTDKTICLMGAYYGLINHYHLYGIPFDADKMKGEMRVMINTIIG